MKTITVIVGPDGRVEIPGTRAGEIVTIQVGPPAGSFGAADPLSAEEQTAIIELTLAAGKRVREQLSAEELAMVIRHDDWLYGPDGLPQ